LSADNTTPQKASSDDHEYIDVDDSSRSFMSMKSGGSSQYIDITSGGGAQYIDIEGGPTSSNTHLRVPEKAQRLQSKFHDIASRDISNPNVTSKGFTIKNRKTEKYTLGGDSADEPNHGEMILPQVSLPGSNRSSGGRGGLLKAIRDPVWYAFASGALVLFSIALLVMGITFSYAGSASGSSTSSLSEIGAYVGVPMILFGFAFLFSTAMAAQQFYKGKNGNINEGQPQPLLISTASPAGSGGFTSFADM
jgi:hypothetical protein